MESNGGKTPVGKTQAGKTQVAKGKKPCGSATTRRTWKPDEEVVLIHLLKELVAAGGWKGENGFRPGYTKRLEDRIRDEIKDTDIRGTPHINSRVTTWKRYHSAIQTALAETGGGFNTVTKILDVSDIAWAKAVAKEPSVSNMRYKPWPYYFDWLEIFGNDGATRSASQTVIDAVNEVVAEDARAEESASHQYEGNYKAPDNDGPCEMYIESQTPNTLPPQQPAPSTSSKRTSQSTPAVNRELIGSLDTVFNKSDQRLAQIVLGIVDQPFQPQHSSCDRSSIYRMLESVPELDLDGRLDVAALILNNTRHWELFSGLPESARSRFVRRLLDGKFD